MNHIKRLAEIFDIDDEGIDENTLLKDIPEWDSMAAISFIAYADKELNISLKPGILEKCITMGDLLALLKSNG